MRRSKIAMVAGSLVALSLATGAGAQSGYVQTTTVDPAAQVDVVTPFPVRQNNARVFVQGGFDYSGMADGTSVSGATLGLEAEMPVDVSGAVYGDVALGLRSGAGMSFAGAGLGYRYYLAPDHQGASVGVRAAMQNGGAVVQATAGYVMPMSAASRVVVGGEVRAGVSVGSWKPAYGLVLKVGMGF